MVYIQSDTDRKLPHHFDCACGLYGAKDHGLETRLTSFEEVQSGKFDNIIKDNVFIGSVEFMKEVFSRIGKTDVRVPENSNRQFKTMTLREAKTQVKAGESLFIKPFDIKLFTGFVLDKMVYSSISDISDDTLVMAYDVFESRIKSEWRCYIGRDRVIDIRNYSGDMFTSPSRDYLQSVIESNKLKFPISYTIDLGILENGENVVIEYNDMWAIGNYGIDNYDYFSLLKSRYFEIVTKS